MPLTCPACNKANQTGITCQRCGCELTVLHAVRAAAAASLIQARAHLLDQQWEEALAAAEQSWDLCHSAEAAQCAFLVTGALGDTAAAALWHERAERNSLIPGG